MEKFNPNQMKLVGIITIKPKMIKLPNQMKLVKND